MLGAAVAAVVLTALANLVGKVSPLLLGSVALTGALVSATVPRAALPQSPWRVPEQWARFGRLPFALAFGVALGLGVLTAIGSAGTYVLFVWGLTGTLGEAFVAFACFGVARALTLVWVRSHGGWEAGMLDRATAVAERVPTFESSVLATLSVVLLCAA